MQAEVTTLGWAIDFSAIFSSIYTICSVYAVEVPIIFGSILNAYFDKNIKSLMLAHAAIDCFDPSNK